MPHVRCSYITLRENLKIPPHQPEAKEILRVSTSLMITRAITIRKKVIVWGLLKSDTEYIAKVPDKTDPVFFSAFEVPCSGFIKIRRAKPDLIATITGEVEFQDYELLNSRDIRAFIIVKIRVGRPPKVATFASGQAIGQAASSPTQKQTEKTALKIKRPTTRNTWTGRCRY